jgi:plastocyanin
MKDTTASDRRAFLKVSGGALLAAGTAGALATSGQHHKNVNALASGDPLGSATVSFGGWMTPLDRFTTLPPPSANHHVLVPNVAKIKAGGYVNFIISGLHVVAVYDDGHQPSDIDAGILVPPPRFGPPIMNDANRRIYRGIDPVISSGPPPVLNLDRVEVVHFADPGTYLVICAVLPHFAEGMYGYVRVLPNKTNEVGGK